MIKRSDILDAYIFLRRHNHSIPDEVLDFIKESSLNALDKPETMSDTELKSVAKKELTKYLMDVVYLERKLCASQNVHGIASSIWDKMNTRTNAKELKPLWSEGKSATEISKVGIVDAVYNLLEDIQCLKEFRTNAKVELVNSYSKLLDDIWADSSLTAIEIRNMIRKFSKELDK